MTFKIPQSLKTHKKKQSQPPIMADVPPACFFRGFLERVVYTGLLVVTPC